MHINGVTSRRLRLGELLLQQEVITQEQLDEALRIQKETGDRLGEILREKGYATEEQICFHLARQLGVPYMSLKSRALPHEVVQLVPRDVAVRHQLIAIDKIGQFITLAMADPLAQAARRQIAEMTGLKVQFVVSSSADITEAIERYYTPPLLDQDTETPEEADAQGPSTPASEEREAEVPTEAEPQLDEEPNISRIGQPRRASESEKRGDEEDLKAKPADPFSLQVEPFAARPMLSPVRVGIDRPSPFSPDLLLTHLVLPEASPISKAIHCICYEPDISTALTLFEAPVGMGKTHLLHAIGHCLQQMTPVRRAEYVDAREICLRAEDTHDIQGLCTEVCQELSAAEVALLDNWHELSSTPTTRRIALLILEHLLSMRIQVVCAACPADSWDESNRSLLESGLHLIVPLPDVPERLTILQQLEARAAAPHLEVNTLQDLAEQEYPNVRSLIARWKRARFEQLSLPHHPLFSRETPD